jgi:hypothetical protein
VNLNYNLIFHLGKKIALMQKIGVGFRKRNVEYSDVLNKIKNDNFEESDVFLTPVSNGFLRDNGTTNGANFNLELKIMYKF